MASNKTTAVAYINLQGGTRSMTLMDLTLDLFGLVQELGVCLRAKHIPGRLNRTADLLSHANQVVNTEWMLNHQVAVQLWKVCQSIDDRLDGDRADDSAIIVHQSVSRPPGSHGRRHVL